jgi:hypothetical protein
MLYTFELLLTKLSILFQKICICIPGRTYRAIYVVIALAVIFSLATFLVCSFPCTPVAYFRDTTLPNGKRSNQGALYLAIGGINIATDILILILPISMLKNLKVPGLQRIFLIVILSPGGL